MREDDKIVNITAHKVIYKNQILELDEEEAGFCMIEKKDDDSVETLYEVKPKFRGTGLGGRLVDFTKEFAKKKGYRYVLLNKQERFVPHPLLKMDIDGNLQLYLNHNFQLSNSIRGKTYRFNMFCDLDEENKMSLDEYMLNILNNKSKAYIKS